MSEVLDGWSDPQTKTFGTHINGRYELVVTHADYRALEEDLYAARMQRDQAEDKLARATEELASLRARVGELVEASNGLLDVTGRGKVCTITESLAAYRRLESALEAMQ